MDKYEISLNILVQTFFNAVLIFLAKRILVQVFHANTVEPAPSYQIRHFRVPVLQDMTRQRIVLQV